MSHTARTGGAKSSKASRESRGSLAERVGFPRPLSLPFDPRWRIGFGSDVHRLVTGRKLILGGIRVPFDKGPIGHSDGDALCHAVCDALLGAAALGDIGRHFPNSSPRWKDASSLIFLQRARTMLAESGFDILNVDSTIELERPHLAPFINRMRRSMADALGLRSEQVSIKAKTGEEIGTVGRGEAIRAEAVVLIGRGQNT